MSATGIAEPYDTRPGPSVAEPSPIVRPSAVSTDTRNAVGALTGSSAVANSQDGAPWYPHTVPTGPVGPRSAAADHSDTGVSDTITVQVTGASAGGGASVSPSRNGYGY